MLKFKARISSMGDNKVIWIPAVLHESTREYEGKKQILVILQTLKELKKEKKGVKNN